MRIISLIASSTEIVHALGLGDQMVGRSHECDYAESVKSLPNKQRNYSGALHCPYTLTSIYNHLGSALHQYRLYNTQNNRTFQQCQTLHPS